MVEINSSPIPQSPQDATGLRDLKPNKNLRFIRKVLWQGKIFPAFWTITSLVSITVNVLLLVCLVVVGRYVFDLKSILKDDLIAGLYTNFMLMDEARIKTTIPIRTEVPAKFDLPLETDTTVILTEDTYIPKATVKLATGGLIINAPADIWLPANTELPVHLSMVVPVDQKIPVELDVEVDIPLNKTDLHVPFLGLQAVLDPYYRLLWQIPESWQDIICGKEPSIICKKLFTE